MFELWFWGHTPCWRKTHIIVLVLANYIYIQIFHGISFFFIIVSSSSRHQFSAGAGKQLFWSSRRVAQCRGTMGGRAEFSSRSNGIWDGTRLDAQYWMVEDSHGLRLRLLCADVQNQSFFTQVVSWRKWSNRKKWLWTLNATTRWKFPLQGLMWMLRDDKQGETSPSNYHQHSYGRSPFPNLPHS